MASAKSYSRLFLFTSPAARNGEPIIEFGRLTDTSTLHFLIVVCLPMFAGLAIAKAMAAGMTMHWWNRRFLFDVASLSLYDFLFVFGWAGFGAILMGWMKRGTTLRRFTRRTFVALSAFFVFYSFVNVWVYGALFTPLTYPLIRMAGDLSDVKSSMGSYVTLPSISSLILAPVVYMAAVYGGLRSRLLAGAGLFRATLITGILIYFAVSEYGYSRRIVGSPLETLAASPHLSILGSYVDHLRGDTTPALLETGPASYRDDFRVAGDRVPPPPVDRATSPIKNVIVVVMESTSTQFLSVYGSHYQTTPALEAESRYSRIYNNISSNDGYTVFSYMPLILSLYPGNGWTAYACEYPHLKGTTAVQVLRGNGYRTAFLTSGALDYRGARHFFENRGFDRAWGCEDFLRAGIGKMTSSWGMDDTPLFDQMLDWIDREPGRPFYLMAWTVQTHHPYPMTPGQNELPLSGDASPAGVTLNHYLNNLRLTDEQLGRLFAHLRQKHLDRNTLVVITGDHGEAFGFPHPCFSHGTALYQECVHVPCIFWSPALFNGDRSDVVGAHIDVNPTIFDVMGLSIPADWQGFSLNDPRRPARAYFCCHNGNLLEGMREGNYKFIYNLTLQREELYDLASDPGEQHNLAPEQKKKCEVYRQRMAGWANFEKTHLAGLVADVKG